MLGKVSYAFLFSGRQMMHFVTERYVNHTAICRLLENFQKTFIESTRERIHASTLIHSNDSCQIWTGYVKRGSNYGQKI